MFPQLSVFNQVQGRGQCFQHPQTHTDRFLSPQTHRNIVVWKQSAGHWGLQGFRQLTLISVKEVEFQVLWSLVV